MKIPRKEINDIQSTQGWLLIYGRRKTGKTFLLRNFIDHDRYYLVRRDGVIVSGDERPIRFENINHFLDDLRSLLLEQKTVILDEFQRLPEFFQDEISMVHPNGRLILTGSSFQMMEKVLSQNSPLLGMLSEFMIDLLDPFDAVRYLDLPHDKSIEYGVFMRDPWTIPVFSFRGDFIKDLWRVIDHSRNAIPRLIGEIFSEESRRRSLAYEAVLGLIGAGTWSSSEISHTLFTRGIIDKNDSRLVSSYIRNLISMGLLEKIPLFRNRKKLLYRVKSPIMETYYYLVDRHNIDERDVSFDEIRENLKKMVNLQIERYFAEAFRIKLGGNREYSLDPEIDFIITEGRKRKPKMFGEVKWGKGSVKGAWKLKENADGLDVDLVLISKENIEVDGVKTYTPEKFLQDMISKTTSGHS
ncbi:MAG: AAA family ATPase [Candidatus Thermoplasmatota archaeon]|nr:AAA family ATPase [Candidatus Thermoplasmatota archaeon]